MKLKTAMSLILFMFAFSAGLLPHCVLAENIAMDTAVLRTLDKVTGRTSTIEVKVGDTADFGTLSIKVNVCKTRPPEEPPENALFLEIFNAAHKNAVKERIFSGWMFSSSPALSALENSLYDVWPVKCKGNKLEALNPKEQDTAAPASEEAEPVVTIEPEVIVIDSGKYESVPEETAPEVFYE